MVIDRVPKKAKPRLFDIVIGEIQDGLAENVGWLDHIFGKAERLVKMVNGKRFYSPNIYIGNNDYMEISPDSNIGNYCFFTLDDPQKVIYQRGDKNELKTSFSLISTFITLGKKLLFISTSLIHGRVSKFCFIFSI